jgi:phosphate transport system substrate-binding protein
MRKWHNATVFMYLPRAALLLAAITFPASGCQKQNGSSNGGALSRLNGGGSTFVGPMMKKWAALYNQKTGMEIDYALKGSGNGIQQMIAKTYHFGCTDAPMNAVEIEAARKNGGDVLHIPLVFGAVVPIYHLPELKDAKEHLKFTGPVLADIFMGKITKWNDAALQTLNTGIQLPDRAIVVVRRADPSGTTFIWTDYLAAVSEDWRQEVGPGAKEVKWWQGAVGKPQNQGVAGHVAATEGAIGYVELDYALSNKLAHGAVQNKDGKSVAASSASVTAAAKGAEATIPDDLCFSLNNQPGDGAYPICGTVWAVLYVNQHPAEAKALVDFLTWCTHDGQKQASALNYAPLSDGLVSRIEQKLKSIKSNQ